MKKSVYLGAAAVIAGIFAFTPMAFAQIPALGAANVATLSGTTLPGTGTNIALQSHANAVTAYNTLLGMGCDQTLQNVIGNGTTLTSGTYCFGSSTTLTGDLTLSGGTNSVFVFKIPGDLTISPGARILLTGGVTPDNVAFQVGGNVNGGAGSSLQGTILANGNIVLGPGTTLNGRALSLSGTVTADPAAVTCATCTPVTGLATLTVNKTVINTHGGTLTPATTPLFVSGMRVQSGATYEFLPGTYALSEIIIQGGYVASAWGGSCSASGSVTLTAGGAATCTITNSDTAGVTPGPGGTPTSTPTSTPGLPNTGGGDLVSLTGLLLALIAAATAVGAGLFFFGRETES